MHTAVYLDVSNVTLEVEQPENVDLATRAIDLWFTLTYQCYHDEQFICRQNMSYNKFNLEN